MTIFSAEMIEAAVDEHGVKYAIILNKGNTKCIPESEAYNETLYSKPEKAVLINAMHNPTWPLPAVFTDRERYLHREIDDLSGLHQRIVRYLRKYVWFSDDNSYDVVANWVISTYFRHVFRYAPLLIFDGVTRSGKSTVLKVLQQIVYRGSCTSNYSAASLARQIEMDRVTLLLDESIDTIQSDRGLEVCSLLKSCFEDGNLWIRADPKSVRIYKYHVYTSTALAVKAEGLPEDIYNRGLRINMVGMPDDLELGDIDSVHEDDVQGDCSPLQLRTELYALRWACMGGVNADNVPVDWGSFKKKATGHFTQKIDKGGWKDQWYYGYVTGIKDAPRIFGRARNIASTLYTIGMCTSSDKPTIEAIIESENANREVIIDTAEALTFSAMVTAGFNMWNAREGFERVGHTIDADTFDRLYENISTTDVAECYNAILEGQGNAGRDRVSTKTVTAKLLALGFQYERGKQNRSYFCPEHPNFKPYFIRYLGMWMKEYMSTFDILSEVKKP